MLGNKNADKRHGNEVNEAFTREPSIIIIREAENRGSVDEDY